jgi:Zn-dependent peptidase ImmA (M78 family)/DNA-binding XRE family transcriptional regulator
MRDNLNRRIARRVQVFRERAGLTQADLADRLGFNNRQTISDIERGEREVRPGELARMAEVLGVTVDDFTDPFRLVGEGAFSFRAGKRSSARDVAAFEEQAGRWIATYRTLAAETGVPARRVGPKLELTPHSSYEDAQACAEALRTEWRLGDYPATTLEDALRLELGALVLYVDAPDAISGAASYLPGQRTILINRKEPRGRQMFDMAHELFHLLTWDAMEPDRVETHQAPKGKGSRVEQLADNFAAALLMPGSTVRELWETRAEGADVYEWLNRTATRLRVSALALSYRVLNLDLVSRSEFEAIDPERLVANGDPGGRNPPPPLFSQEFVTLLYNAVENGRLSLRRASGLLSLDNATFADLCRQYQLTLSYEV